MRILFVSHYALPHLGGIEVVVHELAEELSRRDHSVTVVSAGTGGNASDPSRSYRLIRVPALNTFEERLGIPYPLFSPSLLGVLREQLKNADVVHAHGYLYASSMAALALARATRPAVRILTEHVGRVPYDNVFLDGIEALAATTVGRFCARSAHTVIVCNDRVRSEMDAIADRRPVVTIHNGVDTNVFRPPMPGERERLRRELGWDGGPRVLIAGRSAPKKGLDVAFDVTRRANGAFTLAVAGPDRLPGGAPRSVELLGCLPAERLAAVYRAADVLLVAGRGEGLPLTVPEAMASGLPIVMVDDPGYREVLNGAGPAVCPTPPDAESVVATLLRVLRNPVLRSVTSETAVKFARRSFSWRRTADLHEALYRRLGVPA